MPTRRWLLKSAAALSTLGLLGTSTVEPESLADGTEQVPVGAEVPPTSEEPAEPPEPPEDTDDEPDETDEPQTRNVLDYGADGDGSDDDTWAIQRAFDAAEDGDTVYFPAGEYSVGRFPPEDESLIELPTDIADLTIAGDPGYEQSRIVVSDSMYRAGHNFTVFRLQPRGIVEGLTVRNLTIDGDRPEDGPASRAIYLDPDGSPGGHSVAVEDCWVENFNGPALLFRQGRVRLERITSVDNRQNIGVSERDDSTAGTGEYGIVIRNCVSKNADWVGIDHNQGGKLLIDGLYSENNGNSGLKTTKDNRRTRIQNATFQSENNFAAVRTNIADTTDLPDPPLEISLDTVAIRDAVGGGIYLSGDDSSIQNSELVDGPIEIRNCQGKYDGSEGGLTVHPAAGGVVEELRVIGTVEGPGVWFNANHDLTISTYYHADNEGGAIERYGNDGGGAAEQDNSGPACTVEQQINDDPGPLATPTEDDVGAWSQ